MENRELRKAVLREKIAICRGMVDMGYFPHTVKFDGYGGIEVIARQSGNSDQGIINQMVNELKELEGGAV